MIERLVAWFHHNFGSGMTPDEDRQRRAVAQDLRERMDCGELYDLPPSASQRRRLDLNGGQPESICRPSFWKTN